MVAMRGRSVECVGPVASPGRRHVRLGGCIAQVCDQLHPARLDDVPQRTGDAVPAGQHGVRNLVDIQAGAVPDVVQ
jgi:hypothetical protein